MPPLTILDGEFLRKEGIFHPFDILHIRGVDLRSLSLRSRKLHFDETLLKNTGQVEKVPGTVCRQTSQR